MRNIFHKKKTPIPTVSPTSNSPTSSPTHDPAAAAPPATPTPPRPAGNTSRTQTFKNIFLFASKIAGNIPVPWVKAVTESIIYIIQRFEAMKLNEEIAMDLKNDIEAFLYIVTKNAGQKFDDKIVEQFKGRIESIRDGLQESPNSFIHVEQTKDAITRFRQNLDSAIQLIQTDLQIALIVRMEEFRTWKAEMESRGSGDVTKNVVNAEYKAGGNLKMRVQGTGAVSSMIKGSQFETKKAFNQHTQGVKVVETLENTSIYADDDIDITTLASG